MRKADREIEEKKDKENVSETVNEFSRSSIILDMNLNIGSTNNEENVGDTEQEIVEEKKRENVSGTDEECKSKEDDGLALSLGPPRYSPCQYSPVKEPLPTTSSPLPLFTEPPPEPLPTTSRPLFIQERLHNEPLTTEPFQLLPNHSPFTTTPPPLPTPPRPLPPSPPPLPTPRRASSRTNGPGEGKSDVIPAPYNWATTRRATVHSLDYLVSRQILTISGQVQCKRCEKRFEMQYNLQEKFNEVGTFIAQNKHLMRDRAPNNWMSPTLPRCRFCGAENSVKPCISAKKKSINWLFLLLGQTIGCCTLDQLKYFCKHTNNHRTGAKDRVLYLTYLGLCKQLDPHGPFSPR